MKLSSKALEDYKKDMLKDGNDNMYTTYHNWLNEEVANPMYRESLCDCGHLGHINKRIVSRYKLYEIEEL